VWKVVKIPWWRLLAVVLMKGGVFGCVLLFSDCFLFCLMEGTLFVSHSFSFSNKLK